MFQKSAGWCQQTFILNVSLGPHKGGGIHYHFASGEGKVIDIAESMIFGGEGEGGGDSCCGWESLCTCMKSHYTCILYICVF